METNELLRKAGEYMAGEAHPVFRAEVEDLVARQDWKGLQERFYSTLAFGTGGMRGIIGGGANRMNPLNVRRITQGLASYVLKAKQGVPASAVIAHDSRRYSDLFAREAALVFAANGIRAYVFSGLRPTPELSFAVRKLGATTGIVVTASHNPPQYNGYKVYWEDGAQVVAPHDAAIVREVEAVGEVRVIDEAEARRRGLLVVADAEVDAPFVEAVKAQVLRPDLVRRLGRELRVVYTPLHGTGAVPVAGTLRDLGVEVTIVPEQREPDGEFPTVEYPNPEEASALAMALALGRRTRRGPGDGNRSRLRPARDRRPQGRRLRAGHGEPARRASARLCPHDARRARDNAAAARGHEDHRDHRAPPQDRARPMAPAASTP